jgi:UDP-2,3-diacylglucosamine pyrophosphatase LpxH
MNTPCFDTVILSDLHLGSEVSRASDALHVLKETSFRRLILLGDIFCDLNFARLKKPHWQFLGYIRKLSNPRRNTEVVWVEGNHDQGLSLVMSHLVGVPVYQEYSWDYHGIRHLAIHGHQFDRFVLGNVPLSKFLNSIFLGIEKLDFGKKRISRYVDHLDTTWLRLSQKVAEGALHHAAMRGAQRVFCGHTHEAMRRERNSIEYFNTGSWTQRPATYIAIGETGVNIHEYTEPTDNRDSSEERVEADSAFADFALAAGLPDLDHEGVAG